jgi:hypothetical protein
VSTIVNDIEALNDNDIYQMRVAFEYYLQDLYYKKVEKHLEQPSVVPKDSFLVSASLLGSKVQRKFSDDNRMKKILLEEFNDFMSNKDKALKLFLFYKSSIELNLVPSETPTGKLKHVVSNYLNGQYQIDSLLEKMNKNGIFDDINQLIERESLLSKSEKRKLLNEAYAICFGKSYRIFYILRKQKLLKFVIVAFLVYIISKIDGGNQNVFYMFLLTLTFYFISNFLIDLLTKLFFKNKNS